MSNKRSNGKRLTIAFSIGSVLVAGMAALVLGLEIEDPELPSAEAVQAEIDETNHPDIAGDIDGTPVYLTDEGEKMWEGDAPPIDEEEVAITNPPKEHVGKHAGVGKRLATAPEEAGMPAEECTLLVEELEDSMQLKRKAGLEEVDFEVSIDGIRNNRAIMLAQKMPGSKLKLHIPDDASGEFEVECTSGEIAEIDQFKWEYHVPDATGIECVEIRRKGSDAFMCVRVAVMEPYENEGELDGYRIGKYQSKPYKGNPSYLPPKGLIKVTEETAETWVSPHFRLGQFICKQEGDFPKFLRLETALLVKMELIVEFLKEKGTEVESLYVTSGYRTPHYNKELGNKTNYSRHLYGDAADLFVDNNGDGKMDDLDGSGEVTGNDAKVLRSIVEDITTRYRYLRGGLGFYDVTNYPTPFIHVDTRGYPARWSR